MAARGWLRGGTLVGGLAKVLTLVGVGMGFLPATGAAAGTMTMSGPYYPYNYRTHAFIYGDTDTPAGGSRAIASFTDDLMVFTHTTPGGGILGQYVADRAAAAPEAAAYLGYEDVASLWEGRRVTGISLSGTKVILGGYTYWLSGTVSTSSFVAVEEGIDARFSAEESACATTAVNLFLKVPIQGYTVSGKNLVISKYSGAGVLVASSSFTLISGPALHSPMFNFGLDYGSGATQGLEMRGVSVLGTSVADPSLFQLSLVSGGVPASTIKTVLQQALSTGGTRPFAAAILSDVTAMGLESESGFGQYFTDAVLRANPATDGASSISFDALRFHEVEGVALAELVMWAGRLFPASSGAMRISEYEVAGSGSVLAGAEEELSGLLEAMIPAVLTEGGGGMTPADEDCEADVDEDGNPTLKCTCEADGVTDCEVLLTFGAPQYLYTYQDEDGVTRSFDVQYGWDTTSCAPVREVRAENLAFEVPILAVHVTGKKLGVGFNITGDGAFAVQNLTLGMDFDALAQRGDPERVTCMALLAECLTAYSGSSEDMATCMMAGYADCGGDLLIALGDVNEATEETLPAAVAAVEAELEQSTLDYVRSFLDDSGAEVPVDLELETKNLFIGKEKVDEVEVEITRRIQSQAYARLEELTANQDLLGAQAVILERIHGYHMADDLVTELGTDWPSSYQVAVASDGGQAVWQVAWRH